MKYNSVLAVEVYWNKFFFYEDGATQVLFVTSKY